MRPEHLGLIRAAGRPALSPNGRFAAFTVSNPDTDANSGRSQIWVVPTDASAPARPLTDGSKRDANPAW